MKFSLVGAAGLLSVRAAAADSLSLSSESDIKSTAKTLAARLLQYYHGDEPGAIPGILPGPPPAGEYYWWSASAVWASLVDYWYFTGDTAHNDVVMRALLAQAGDDADYMPANQTVTMGNDDQGFWGLAALTAAERRFPDPPRDGPQWLGLARSVFDDLTGRWDEGTCGGGLRWQILPFNRGYEYKNSASTGVLFNLGARLARYTGNSTFGDWADKAWSWSSKTGLLDNGAVYDGGHTSDNCSKILPYEFSHVSGLFILGAASMYNTTSDAKWKDRLDSILTHSVKTFFKNGVAFEAACEGVGRCNVDMTFYKGLYAQMLAAAAQLAPHVADTVLPLLKTSAAAAVRACDGPDGACGLNWTAVEEEEEEEDDDDDAAGKEAGAAGAACSVLSSVSPLLARADDVALTGKTGGGTSSSGGGGNSTSRSGGGDDKAGKTGKDGGGAGKGAAGKTSVSMTLGLVMMTCVASVLLV